MRGAEDELTLGEPEDAIPVLVHQPMVSATEQDQIVELCEAAIGPVLDMMRVDVAVAAAGKAAAAITMLQGAPNGGWNGASAAAHVEDIACAIVRHHDQAGIAGEAT